MWTEFLNERESEGKDIRHWLGGAGEGDKDRVDRTAGFQTEHDQQQQKHLHVLLQQSFRTRPEHCGTYLANHKLFTSKQNVFEVNRTVALRWTEDKSDSRWALQQEVTLHSDDNGTVQRVGRRLD